MVYKHLYLQPTKDIYKMRKLAVMFTLGVSALMHAQKMKIVSGNYDFLKDQKELNLVMNFSDVKFYKENMDEAAYVLKREKEILDAGKSNIEFEEWKQDWQHFKRTVFTNKFLASMNKNTSIVTSINNNDAKYTLQVETVWIYPGWYAGVMAQPSKVSTILKFVETLNPTVVLLEIESKEAPGDNFVGVPNNNDRIAEGYAKTAKTLAKKISKKVK